jgi:NAD(P)-dependent dehydrogenase (short-subunit alcohol dehydrogenase family)
MSAELSGVSAVVTGGTSGIGRATAVALARLGAHVAVVGRDKDRGDEVVREISLHSALGYRTPQEVLEDYLNEQEAA